MELRYSLTHDRDVPELYVCGILTMHNVVAKYEGLFTCALALLMLMLNFMLTPFFLQH